jgi:hypothetical protein
MKYPNGEDIRIGDHLKIGSQDEGVVVAKIESGNYLEGYLAEDWSYLQKGILVSTQKAGLIHYLDHDEKLTLISRR